MTNRPDAESVARELHLAEYRDEWSEKDWPCDRQGCRYCRETYLPIIRRALAKVERETAEKCAEIASVNTFDGPAAWAASEIARDIRVRFGLKG